MFLEVLGKVTYILFLIGGVIFGISLAVELLVVITVRKMTKSTAFRFETTLDETQKDECLKVIKNAEQEFSKCIAESNVINKIKRGNKVRKFFKLKQKDLPKPTHSVKEVFLKLIKDVSVPITTGAEKGYMSFTEKDVFNIARSVKDRFEEILYSSSIPWLKTLKISFVLKCLDVYKVYSNVKQGVLVTIIINLINFFTWFARVFNPVSMSKILIKNASGSTLTLVLAKTTIEIVGKELAVLYHEKTYLQK